MIEITTTQAYFTYNSTQPAGFTSASGDFNFTSHHITSNASNFRTDAHDFRTSHAYFNAFNAFNADGMLLDADFTINA